MYYLNSWWFHLILKHFEKFTFNDSKMSCGAIIKKKLKIRLLTPCECIHLNFDLRIFT